MSAELIQGLDIARMVQAELREKIEKLSRTSGRSPGLAVVLVGDDPASQSYVGGKRKACEQLGVRSLDHDLPSNTSEEELMGLVQKLNGDSNVDGILVQLPLPKHIDESKVLLSILPDKDVDGYHPINIGKLLLGHPAFIPCTPHGVQQLLVRSGVSVEGAEVVIVGRSHTVGRPLANLLSQKGTGADATVTLCHSHTRDLAQHTRRADILVAAVGRPKTITASMVKEGAVVIDVGVNRVGTSPKGKALLCGDVDFENVSKVASRITPVPGGVGPMTIAMLMVNTVLAAEQHLS
jgi:methylenetetrahydrofolate dehydrogenase (NADP+) / methenyltetrahydrofolate cyclohydrolase